MLVGKDKCFFWYASLEYFSWYSVYNVILCHMLCHVILWVLKSKVAHQWGLTQQLGASDQVSDGDVEVGVATAPVGDLSEWVCGQDVLLRWELENYTVNTHIHNFHNTHVCARKCAHTPMHVGTHSPLTWGRSGWHHVCLLLSRGSLGSLDQWFAVE